MLPRPTAAGTLRAADVRQVLRRHRIRRVTAEEVLKTLQAPSVHLAPGVREGVAPRVAALIEQLRLVDGQRRRAAKRLETLLQTLAEAGPTEKTREHPDVTILQSLPGIGMRIAATMLAEAPQALRDRDYHGVRTLGGIAPVTRQSGKRRTVRMRYACQRRVRTALYWWGMAAIQRDPCSRAHYDALRQKGHSHGRALRGVVDRLLAVLIALLRGDSLYDATRRRGSAPVAA